MKSCGRFIVFASLLLSSFAANGALADEPVQPPKAFIDGQGPGWIALSGEDFTNVNCNLETWAWEGGHAYCTGKPIGVIRTKKMFKNFELVAQWQHKKSAGNSGIFIWATDDGMKDLKPDDLPKIGIEVQMLDHGYRELYAQKSGGKKDDWFTTDGDIFAVGRSKLKPFPPLSPNGSRSFPRKRLSKGFGEWNHYYVRAINGEVRLWVNGEEVSGGSDAIPSEGYICLESEGSPVEFKDIRVRELP
jgi:3-keto-disaccharide hydrolase